MHTLQHLKVWIGLVNNSDHFTWRAVCLLGYISTASGGIFWKCIPLTHCTRALQTIKVVSIGLYSRALYLKSIVLSEMYLGLYWRDFPENSYCAVSTHSQHRWMFGSHLSIIKGTLLSRAVCFFRLYLSFQWRDFPENSHLTLSTHALQTLQVWLRSANNYTLAMFNKLVIEPEYGHLFILVVSAVHGRKWWRLVFLRLLYLS